MPEPSFWYNLIVFEKEISEPEIITSWSPSFSISIVCTIPSTGVKTEFPCGVKTAFPLLR